MLVSVFSIYVFFFFVICSSLVFGHGGYFFKDAWNVFDFAVILLSDVDLVLGTVPGVDVAAGISALRLLRVVRIFRLLKSVPELQELTEVRRQCTHQHRVHQLRTIRARLQGSLI